MTSATEKVDFSRLAETDLVEFARAGREDAFRTLMRRCNQRLFRTARSILGDDAEAEDVLQESYLRAFASLDGFRGDASVLTWLTRIVINEARGRLRKRRSTVGLSEVETAQADEGRILAFPSGLALTDPEREAARAEARRLVERAIDQLPQAFRLVFILRDVDGCSAEETAEALGLKTETVKTRLHRARRALREQLENELGGVLTETFPFLGRRCERVTANVLEHLRESGALS